MNVVENDVVKPQFKRLFRAMAIVIAIITMPLLVNIFSNVGGQNNFDDKYKQMLFDGALQQKAINVESFGERILNGQDVGDMFKSGASKIDSVFEDETFSFSDKEEVYVSDVGGVIGYLDDRVSFDVQEEISSVLQISGWKQIDSGSREIRTYIKTTGKYRWLLVLCIQVGDSTSVVMRFNPSL